MHTKKGVGMKSKKKEPKKKDKVRKKSLKKKGQKKGIKNSSKKKKGIKSLKRKLDKALVVKCIRGQFGLFKWIFFLFYFLPKLGRLQFGGLGEKTPGPHQFSFPFSSLIKHTKLQFFLLFLSYFFHSP